MTPQEASEELKEEFEIFKNSIDPADWKNPNEELKKIIEANTMAIKALETASCIKEKCAYCPHCEHCDVDDETLAIKALEQQPCEDAISREDAIRIAEQGQIQGYEWQFKKLCNLPSVTSKTRWITGDNKVNETIS